MDEQNIVVRPAQPEDVKSIAKINAAVFTGNRDNLKAATNWVRNHFEFVYYFYFVIEVDGEFAGYIGWQIPGGELRPMPAIELEQLGIDPAFQSQGLASKIVEQSMPMMVSIVKKMNTRIESKIIFFVWCYAHNKKAISVYQKMFPEQSGTRRQYGERDEIQFRRFESLVLD
jgi:ribosomal protein S18 acetylase RimI-like enzyme